MGYSSWWLAVSGKEPERVLRELGLNAGREEARHFYDGDVVTGSVPGGWFFVFLNRNAWAWFEEPLILALSAGCRVVTCEAEEHAMYSTATGYSDGRRLWFVEHPEPGILNVDGNPPPELGPIAASLRAQQEEADRIDEEVDYIFGIPVELAKSITGFRYDERMPEGAVFHVLEEPAPGWAPPAPASTPPPPSSPGPKLNVARPDRPWWKFW